MMRGINRLSERGERPVSEINIGKKAMVVTRSDHVGLAEGAPGLRNMPTQNM